MGRVVEWGDGMGDVEGIGESGDGLAWDRYWLKLVNDGESH
jgi:hypothetical protein